MKKAKTMPTLPPAYILATEILKIEDSKNLTEAHIDQLSTMIEQVAGECEHCGLRFVEYYEEDNWVDVHSHVLGCAAALQRATKPRWMLAAGSLNADLKHLRAKVQTALERLELEPGEACNLKPIVMALTEVVSAGQRHAVRLALAENS